MALALGASLLGVGCCAESLPEPETALRTWAAQLETEAPPAMELASKAALSRFGRMGVEARLTSERSELVALLRESTAVGATVTLRVHWRLKDGRTLSFSRAGAGSWTLEAPPGLRGAPTTVEDFAREWGALMVQSDFSALTGLLVDKQRDQLEAMRSALAEELKEFSACEVKEQGDTAVISTPRGYVLRLRRQGGVWRLEELQ
jgi:hypothetical protein